MESGRLVMERKEYSNEYVPVHITANSLIHDDVTLEDALQIASEAGFDGFEVRHELLPLTLSSTEIQAIHQQLQQFPMAPTYSKPFSLFQNGRFEPVFIQQTLAEARSFGCRRIKFSAIGVAFDEQEFVGLPELCTLLHREATDIVVTVENDQSMASGDLLLWERFFARTTALACPIKMTFDLANWTCADTDAVEAAKRLGRYVEYIHVKSVERQGNRWASVPISQASISHPAFAFLPTSAPRALEFPLMTTGNEELQRSLSTYITWIRSGKFAIL
jgi:sugar phosphate isomerase/epimerase